MAKKLQKKIQEHDLKSGDVEYRRTADYWLLLIALPFVPLGTFISGELAGGIVLGLISLGGIMLAQVFRATSGLAFTADGGLTNTFLGGKGWHTIHPVDATKVTYKPLAFYRGVARFYVSFNVVVINHKKQKSAIGLPIVVPLIGWGKNEAAIFRTLDSWLESSKAEVDDVARQKIVSRTNQD